MGFGNQALRPSVCPLRQTGGGVVGSDNRGRRSRAGRLGQSVPLPAIPSDRSSSRARFSMAKATRRQASPCANSSNSTGALRSPSLDVSFRPPRKRHSTHAYTALFVHNGSANIGVYSSSFSLRFISLARSGTARSRASRAARQSRDGVCCSSSISRKFSIALVMFSLNFAPA